VKGDLDRGEAADGLCKLPMAMVMEMAMEMGTVVTPVTADSASTATLEPEERNEHRKRRMRSETPVATAGPEDLRSRMERTAQQQACELA